VMYTSGQHDDVSISARALASCAGAHA